MSSQPQTQTQTTYELAGWWQRAGAFLIDGIVVGVPGAILGVLVSIPTYGSFNEWASGDEFNAAGESASLILGLVIAVAYYCIMMPRTNGQTLGKMALGIRVVREDGGPITAGFAFKRQILVQQLLFGWVALLACYIPTILNYLAPTWDDGNRAWHDRIVGSRVVMANSVPPPQTPSQPAQPQQQPFPVAPPAPAAPGAPQPPVGDTPPPPPAPPGGSVPYTPPPGFQNPVPEDEK